MWVKLSDTFAEDPRWEKLGAAGMALHVAALCYCNRLLTDGVLTRTRAERLFPVDDPAGVVDSLITAGFWRVIGDDVEIVDYDVDQKKREQVEAERAAARERMNRLRSGEHRANFTRSSTTPSRPGVPKGTQGRDGTRSAGARSAEPPRPRLGIPPAELLEPHTMVVTFEDGMFDDEGPDE